MIEVCQRNVGATDQVSLKTMLLQTDGPAARARRVSRLQLEGQQSERAAVSRATAFSCSV